MNMSQAFTSINWLAVILAAASGFVIGGIWYGPLFRNAWMAASGVTMEQGKKQNPVKLFGSAYVLNLIIAISLSMFLGPQADWSFGLIAGLMAALTFVAPALGTIYLFEMRPLSLFLINVGYQTLNFATMGVILGAWR
jgi:hypothetical protein